MKIFNPALCYCVTLVLLTSCTLSEQPKLNWYKGNLHTHSYWSDGDEFPEMVMDWYKTHGYDFVALSDHNTLAEGEKWKLISRLDIYQQGFKNYLEKFGKDWVIYRIDTGRTHVLLKTLAEYRGLFEDNDFLIIQSEEITDSFDGKPIHMNATNIQTYIEPQHGGSVTEVMQRNLDAVLQQRNDTGVPMFPHLNHPNFYYTVSADDMIGLRGERFFEVYNGHPLINNAGDSAHISTEEMWDRINIAYAERNQPLLLGLATDDSHNYFNIGASWSNPGRGWVMVHADSLTPSSLIQAMESGNFYSSTGVTLEEVNIDGNNYGVKVSPDEGVKYVIQFVGVRKGRDTAEILQESPTTEATYSIPKDVLFVRAKIISTKPQDNPTAEREFEAAWTQPVRPE